MDNNIEKNIYKTMKKIKANIDFNYYPSASEECRTALLELGYKSFRIVGYTGSHHADVYVFDEDEERFKNELLNNVVIGQYRRFYFSKSFDSFGQLKLCYNVGYSKIKK